MNFISPVNLSLTTVHEVWESRFNLVSCHVVVNIYLKDKRAGFLLDGMYHVVIISLVIQINTVISS